MSKSMIAMVALIALGAAAPAQATPKKDPIIAASVTAVCVDSSRYPVPQSVRIDLSASAVRVSTESLSTCSAALRTARTVAKKRKAPRGYTCTASGPSEEDFTEHNSCTLTRSGTTVRLRFDVILD